MQQTDDQLKSISNGKSPVNVFYGDSQLRVEPPFVSVKKHTSIEFKLNPVKSPGNDPAGVDYDEIIVTIMGKNTEGNWLNVSGKGKGAKFVVDAPDPGATACTYEYTVTVQGVGQLDPRAEVIP